jgi:molybdopterin-containing oxidoreductase family iron-sulfur binding subunit
VGGGIGGSGERRAVELEVAVLLLNVLAGNVGQTVTYGAGYALDRLATRQELAHLADAMMQRQIDVLLIHHANPVHTLPPATQFAAALDTVPFIVSFASAPDETTDRAHLILPDHHPLESWGSYAPRAGIASIMQPAATPMFDTRAAGDVLIHVGNQIDGDVARAVGHSSWADYVRASWPHEEWEAVLRTGGRFEDVERQTPSLRDVSALFAAMPEIGEAPGDTYTLLICPSTRTFDGRSANDSWLQEVPDPVTTIVWNDWIDLHPDAARRLGVRDGDLVRVISPHGRAETAVHVFSGMRPDVVAMPIGFGHSASSRTAGGRGANAVALLPAQAVDAPHAAWRASRVRLERVDKQRRVIMLQATTASRESPESLFGRIVSPARVDSRHPAEHAPIDFYPPHTHPEHRWGMAIDLNSCTGCNACVVACYAENNIAVVGEQFCAQGREMSWIRIERHEHALAGDGSVRRPGNVFLPMLCQHCDEAPCEAVCPVYATYHNPEGLNAQIYARCIGTRFCSNNCPYKVRRFNFARYGWPAPLGEQLNPDVTVRSTGVMEKCTFCVQRIHAAKLDAKREARPLRDGDVTPACAQTCPAEAIVFGDLNDPNSRVSRLSADARGYHVLEELNTRPAITYLRRSVPGAPDDVR